MFKDGDLIGALYFEDDTTLDHRHCDKIICVFENGQMDGVPWFEVYKDGEMISKWNGALVHGVGFKKD